MRYWFDTEFNEDGKTIELISIGIVAEDGRKFYAESGEFNVYRANDFVRENILPVIDIDPVYKRPKNGISREQIRDQVNQFIGVNNPEFWAYYGSYDWVVLCQLFGRMVDLPDHWPMYCNDVKQLELSLGNPQLPDQQTEKHNALNDAIWTKNAWDFLIEKQSRLLEKIRQPTPKYKYPPDTASTTKR
jgi:hypothetical protein